VGYSGIAKNGPGGAQTLANSYIFAVHPATEKTEPIYMGSK